MLRFSELFRMALRAWRFDLLPLSTFSVQVD
jgi:hypothetical protein